MGARPLSLSHGNLNIRCAMERKFPGVEWKSADLRKELIELAKEGRYRKMNTIAVLVRLFGVWR